MPLESFQNRIDIKDLALDTPEQIGPIFDIEQVIKPADWSTAKINLYVYEKSEQWTSFLRLASYMKLCFPQRAPELEIYREAVPKIKKALLQLVNEGVFRDWGKYIEEASHLKILFPDIDIMTDQDWDEVQVAVDNAQIGYDTEMELETFAKYKILFTDRFEQLDQQKIFNAEKWNNIAVRLNDLRNLHTWSRFVQLAVSAKLLYPNDKYNLDITKEDWAGMKQWLEVFKEKLDQDSNKENYFWPPYMGMAGDMKLLSASKINITKDGIKVVMNNEEVLSDEISNLPVLRKF